IGGSLGVLLLLAALWWLYKEGNKGQVEAIACLARRCLDLNGKRRPTMNEVAMELEEIQNPVDRSSVQQNYEEVEYVGKEVTGPWDDVSASTGSAVDNI
ncbi:hypothetical protein DVH24_032622, partial [Malus domestica]